QEDELTLRVGNIIRNVITAEGGWWEGELNGKKGMFPENFVKVGGAIGISMLLYRVSAFMIVLRSKEPAKKEEKREAAQRKSVRELANKFKDGVPMGGSMVQKKKAPEVKPKKCKVLFEYKPENGDELELTVGSIIDFHREVEEGWWEGTLNGRSGVFPSNFVEMIENGEGDMTVEAERPPPPGEKDESFQEIKGKKVMGVGLGNIFGGGPIKLRNTGKKPDPSKTKADDRDTAKPKLPDSHPPDIAKRDKPQGERAIVRFSYAAEQPDELSLKEGDVIRVLDKNLEDEGWWRGEVNGKSGVFPDNFVELLPQEEPVKAPKKPPPPAGKNLYPKLPEKAPSSAPLEDKTSSLRKEHARRKSGLTKRRIVEYVGKKPGAAPKPSEAPTKPEPPKVAESAKVELRHKDPVRSAGSVDSNHHPAATENDKTEDDDSNFDVLETSSQKLQHLTANRAKGPKKRPPSTVLVPGDVERPGEEEYLRTPNHGNHQAVLSDSERSHYQRYSGVHEPHLTKEPHLLRDRDHSTGPPPRPPEPSRPHESAADIGGGTAALMRLVEDLQREVRELRSHTVSKNDFNDLHSDYRRLKQEFETFRTTTSKKLRELMMEVDEEKKLRLNTQVEMERVKKLLAESQV
ncbi:hypothetical protein BaRGS_00031105, partial [Batillaria attramentaria]